MRYYTQNPVSIGHAIQSQSQFIQNNILKVTLSKPMLKYIETGEQLRLSITGHTVFKGNITGQNKQIIWSKQDYGPCFGQFSTGL
jgi:hypothetical protein